MPDLLFMDELPRQYAVFLSLIAIVCGYGLDWTLGRWAFGIFPNIGILWAGGFCGFVVAEITGRHVWDGGLEVFLIGIAGAVVLFVVLAWTKNKVLP